MRRFLLLALALTACTATPADDWDAMVNREDARDADADFWERQLTRASDARWRARAARGIGRMRDASLAPMLQRAFAVEPEDEVRAELVFAMGQVVDGDLEDEILDALSDDNPFLRARGIEALAKHDMESASSALVGLLGDPDAEVRGQALLGLVRLRGRRSPPEEALEPATEQLLRQRMLGLLADADASVRWRAAYALSEIELEGRQPSLIQASRSDEPTVRFFACMGLLRLAGKEELEVEPLVARLVDEDPHVAAVACVALGRTGAIDAADALRTAAQRNDHPSDFHVRAAAMAALEDVSKEGDLASLRVVQVALEDPSRTVRGRALRTLVHLDPGAVAEVTAAASSEDVYWRMAAARAAAQLPEAEAQRQLLRLAQDSDSRVVVESLSALEDAGASRAVLRERALEAMRHPDLAIKGTGLTMLQTHGGAGDLEAVTSVFRRSPGFDDAEVRVTAVQTAIAIAKEGAADFLEQAIQDPSPAVQNAAATGLAEFGRDVPDVHFVTAHSTPELEAERDYASDAPNPRAVLHTDRGAIELELLREEAPHHVRSFLDLAADGVYDGLLFHRVVTGFVVQGLDPRGDGWGTGGAFLRDEINPVPYLAGAVGMPNAGADTGGCQIFITHVPTPHLDGRYTVFARVVSGMDVVHAIEVGDRCREVELRP